MKFIFMLFNHLLAPLIVLLMALLGLMSITLSGAIEFFVIQDFFVNITVTSESSSSIFFPLTIVVILEGTKLFLHFGNQSIIAACKSDKSATNTQLQTILTLAKVSLVSFSFFCSLVFVSNALYSDVPTLRDSYIAEKTAEHELSTNEAIEAIELNLQNSIESSIQIEKEAYDNAVANLEKWDSEPTLTPQVAYERWLLMHEELTEKVTIATDAYQIAKDNAELNYTTIANEKIQALSLAHAEYVTALSSDLDVLSEGDNPLLRSFLLFFSETFFSTSYTRPVYFSIALTISLLISAFLEFSISLSSTLISLPEKKLSQAFSASDSLDAQTKKQLKFIFNILAGTLISCSIFTIFGLILEISMNDINLFHAFLCYVLTTLFIFMYQYFQRTSAGASSDKAPFFRSCFSKAHSMFIESIVSILIFIVIGVVTGDTFTGLSLSTIGISVGSLGGNLIRTSFIST